MDCQERSAACEDRGQGNGKGTDEVYPSWPFHSRWVRGGWMDSQWPVHCCLDLVLQFPVPSPQSPVPSPAPGRPVLSAHTGQFRRHLLSFPTV